MLARRLKELRKLKGLTQAELARLLGVSTSAVGMYEQARREPDHETLARICSTFHVSSDFLLGSGGTAQKNDLNSIVEALREAILQQDGLMFNGEIVNPADSEKIIDAIKLGISFVMGQNK